MACRIYNITIAHKRRASTGEAGDYGTRLAHSASATWTPVKTETMLVEDKVRILLIANGWQSTDRYARDTFRKEISNSAHAPEVLISTAAAEAQHDRLAISAASRKAARSRARGV